MAFKTTKSASSTSRVKAPSAPQEDASSLQSIRREAYYIYLRRMKNNAAGSDLSDWLEAERAVRSSR